MRSRTKSAIDVIEKHGVENLPIPQNYYDDAETRLGLSANESARMQKHNILCDEENGQRFYQLYSMRFGDGSFFEVVERQAGHKGYGATNAPFRTAACTGK